MAQLSQVNLWNKNNGKMEVMYNAREKGGNILCYVDFAILCQVIKYFTQLNPNFGKEDITFPISSSPRAIEWKKYINEFESGLPIITMTSLFIKNVSV